MGGRTSVRQWILAVAGLAMVAAAGVLFWRSRVAEQPVATAPPATFVAPQLSVHREGDVLRVRWDPQAPALRSASRVALVIDDGPHESRLNLESRDVAAGAASYWPESRDVSFRLETDGAVAASAHAAAAVASVAAAPPAPAKSRAPAKRVRAHARRPAGPVYVADPPKQRKSFVAKIPLLRRLRKHRD